MNPIADMPGPEESSVELIDDTADERFTNGSASGTERLIACPASLVLPRVRRQNPYADRGHDIHNFIRAVLTGTPMETALESVDPAHRGTCSRIEWPKLGGDLENIRCEVAYALDPVNRTARFLGINIGRNYKQFNLTETEIPGSLDIEGTERMGEMRVVLDAKSGWAEVTEPEENGQGLFFGAVNCLLYGVDRSEFRIAKLAPDGSIRIESTVYDRFEIDSFLDDLEDAIAEKRRQHRIYLARGTVSVNEGDWCRYCDAFDHCPAKNRLAQSMLTDVFDLHARVQSMSLEEAGKAWTIAHDRIEPILGTILDALKERARREPIPVSEGKVLREFAWSRSDFCQKTAIALLKQLGASDEQISGLYRTSRFGVVKVGNDPNAPKKKATRKRKAAA